MPEPTDPVADRISTPLLTLITQQSLDEDYQEVAERRSAGTAVAGPEGRRPHWVAAAVVGVFGILVTVAAVQTSQRAGVESSSRTTLIQRIESGRDRVADLQRRMVSLREVNVALQDELDSVTGDEQSATARVRRLDTSTGFGPVTGPGVRVTVDDAPAEAVRDEDLGLLVNGLWSAGAEAVSINGERLTSRTAIRNSGDTIYVNFPHSLSPPYVVSAIGDTRTLQADLMETRTGLQFRDVANSLGFPWNMDNVDELSLPAAPPRMLRLHWVSTPGARPDTNQQRKEIPR